MPAKPRARRPLDRRRRALAGAFLALVAGGAAWAQAAPPELLAAETAFALSAQGLTPTSVAVRFDVADGYYLYREKLRLAVTPGVAAAPVLPPGKVKDDAFFGTVETYRGRVEVELKLAAARPGSEVTLVVDSQGCADQGVCYPARRQTLVVPLPRQGERPAPWVEAAPRKKSWFN